MLSFIGSVNLGKLPKFPEPKFFEPFSQIIELKILL